MHIIGVSLYISPTIFGKHCKFSYTPLFTLANSLAGTQLCESDIYLLALH